MKESYTFNPQATVRICKGRFRCRIVIQHRRLVEGGARIARDGALPINTNGGQLSGGRIHGLGYGHEACTPLWGRGGARQIKAHQVAVAVSRGGPLGGSLLLVKA